MADFLDRLVAREFGTAHYVMPRVGALFEEQPPFELSTERFSEGDTIRDFRKPVDLPEGDVERRFSPGHHGRALDPRAANASIDGSVDRLADKPEGTSPGVSTTMLQPQIATREAIETRESAALTTSQSLRAANVAPERAAGRANVQPTAVTIGMRATSEAPRTPAVFPEIISHTNEERTKSGWGPDRDARSSRVRQLQEKPDEASGQRVEHDIRRDAALTPMHSNAARAMLRLPTTRHEIAAAREPDVEITIGRVEVRASRGHTPAAPRDNGQRPLGLADYLQQRHEARRR